MATAQASHMTCDPISFLSEPYSLDSETDTDYNMGSVGSLVEKQDFSPATLGGLRGMRQPDGLLRKGMSQHEVFGYLRGGKRDTRAEKKHQSSGGGFKRDYESDRENQSPEWYFRDNQRGADFSKSSLPERGRFDKTSLCDTPLKMPATDAGETLGTRSTRPQPHSPENPPQPVESGRESLRQYIKDILFAAPEEGRFQMNIRRKFPMCRIRPSAFKVVSGKSFLSMQGLSSSKGQKLSKSNGSLHTLLTQSSTGSSSQRGPLRSHLLHTISLDEGSNSIQSFPTYNPRFKPAPSQFSASVGHINHIGGSLDRASRGPWDPLAVEKAPLSCKSLSRLQSSGEPPPPYEPTYSLEDVVKQLEDRLSEKGMELRQLTRNLNMKDDPFAQIFEDKQRLWMEELEELKQMYVAKLQQVTQQAQRSQRALQLQLYKAQQEKKRLQEELALQQSQCEELRQRQQQAERLSPKLEETKWEVCQKTAEISLLKQQIRDTQEEMTQKLSEIFSLKSQLREARTELQAKDSQLVQLGDSLQALPEHGSPLPPRDSPMQACQDFLGCETDDSKCRGMQGESAEGPEWLWAELLQERRQAQLRAANFEQERKTWQQEKEKVLRYQREIQASYMEMYHRNQDLERQLSEFRQAEPRSINSESPWIERVESSKI